MMADTKPGAEPARHRAGEGARVALITGAAGGIGAAAVRLFRDRGWRVVAVDRLKNPEADRSITADISSEEALREAFASVRTEFGRLDAMVCNAAEQICKPVAETTSQEWDRIMAVNVKSVFLSASFAFPLLNEVRGCIVNVSSIHALATSKGMAAYAASKAALLSLTRSMALDFASHGIRVNAVLPGAIDTPMLAAGLKREHLSQASPGLSPLDALAARHPLGRVGRPEEVAEAIYFLSDGEKSSFITGQALVVDGGAYARLSTE